jgi:hypothetical protein
MAAMRAVGPVLSLVGGASIGLASVSHFAGEPSLTAGMGAGAAAGLGALAFTAGFAFCMARSRPFGRAGTAFVIHMTLTSLNAAVLYLWLTYRGPLHVAAILALTLVAQLAVGAAILVFAASSGRKVGAAFALALTSYLLLFGAGAFLTWKGW